MTRLSRALAARKHWDGDPKAAHNADSRSGDENQPDLLAEAEKGEAQARPVSFSSAVPSNADAAQAIFKEDRQEQKNREASLELSPSAFQNCMPRETGLRSAIHEAM
ncbi:hypothetical protein JAO29_03075 [Edaphobacter sp. HDX4]